MVVALVFFQFDNAVLLAMKRSFLHTIALFE